MDGTPGTGGSGGNPGIAGCVDERIGCRSSAGLPGGGGGFSIGNGRTGGFVEEFAAGGVEVGGAGMGGASMVGDPTMFEGFAGGMMSRAAEPATDGGTEVVSAGGTTTGGMLSDGVGAAGKALEGEPSGMAAGASPGGGTTRELEFPGTAGAGNGAVDDAGRSGGGSTREFPGDVGSLGGIAGGGGEVKELRGSAGLIGGSGGSIVNSPGTTAAGVPCPGGIEGRTISIAGKTVGSAGDEPAPAVLSKGGSCAGAVEEP